MSLKLDSIEIKGLKCYENSDVIPFHDLTVFIGENDAGKSTIFDAIEYFFNNQQPLIDDYREDIDSIEIECIFSVTENIEELENFILENKITIQKIFPKHELIITKVIGNNFLDNDLNIFNDMSATSLKELLIRLGLESQANQELRKISVQEYIEEHNPEQEECPIAIPWNRVSRYIPIFQRYSSSDYGNPTSTIRKTLELVYRESFYELDEDGNEILKTNFNELQVEIETNLDTKLETQLLLHIQKYKPEIVSISGNYDIDFTRGLSFSGLNIDDGTGRASSLEHMGDGSKKKVFLSILEWDSEINISSESTRNIIRGYDEPDAHLHYHAQREMFYIIKDLAEDEDSNIQSIICTHALTMIDRAPAKCINHVVKTDDTSKIKFLETDDDSDISDFLNQISEVSGFRNSNIFYEKCFLIVEGEGEENALPIMYKKFTGKSLIEDGVILINLQTNGQWSNALKFLNKNKKESTVLFLDTDTQYDTSNSRVTKERLEEIGYDEFFLDNHCFFIGTKEFEDVFCDATYKDLCNEKFIKDNGNSWEESDFYQLRSSDKFSEELKIILSRECRRGIGKPEISLELANYIHRDKIENILPIKNLFEKINEIIV